MDNTNSNQDQLNRRFYGQFLIMGILALAFLCSISDALIFTGCKTLQEGQSRIGTIDNSEAYRDNVQSFVKSCQVAWDESSPVCKPDPNSDIYIEASNWKYEPVLILKKGSHYNLHLSSTDVSHGFRIDSLKVDTIVEPGSELIVGVTPTETGSFEIRCEEFCGAGHELMLGSVIVEN